MSSPPVHPNEFKRRMLDPWPGQVERLGDPFRPLEPECEVVQFGRALTDEQYRRAGEILAAKPDTWLRVYMPRSRDLSFLAHFPGLRRLELEVHELDDLTGLSSLESSLERFGFGKTRKRFSVAFLARMPRLRHLFLEGHTKDLEVLGRLVDLTHLGLRGITLPDLELILPLRELRELSIQLGGTRDLRLLPRFARLERLDLMRITQLDDLGMLDELTGLKSLTLDWLRNVTRLPSLAPLTRLEEVNLDTLKGLSSLEPIAAAPALRRLQVYGAPQFKAKDFACFLGHPSLETMMAAPGGNKVFEEIKRMFPGIAR